MKSIQGNHRHNGVRFYLNRSSSLEARDSCHGKLAGRNLLVPKRFRGKEFASIGGKPPFSRLATGRVFSHGIVVASVLQLWCPAMGLSGLRLVLQSFPLPLLRLRGASHGLESGAIGRSRPDAFGRCEVDRGGQSRAVHPPLYATARSNGSDPPAA